MEPLKPQQNVPLARHSTMRLGGPARYLMEIASSDQVEPAYAWAKAQGCKVIMIGDGSNIVWRDEGFDGLVLVNKIKGLKVEEDGNSAKVTIGAGENWDHCVNRLVKAGFSGVEHLSLIPGTAGATPVQNVGAYGKEIADALVSVQAFDTVSGQMVTIPNSECGFSYRKSRFNTQDRGRFFIVSICLSLGKTMPKAPFYGALQAYLNEHNITRYTPEVIRKAVIEVRNSKLPDPAKVANCGSFFANPIVDASQLAQLIEKFPDIPNWKIDDDKSKVSAAWMLEQLGMKGYHDPNTGMAIWDKHSLVFVNEKAPNTAALLAFRAEIIKKAEDKFGVTLKQEPELI